MESSNGSTPKMTQITDFQMGHENMITTRSDHVFQTTSALEILREIVRILSGFEGNRSDHLFIYLYLYFLLCHALQFWNTCV